MAPRGAVRVAEILTIPSLGTVLVAGLRSFIGASLNGYEFERRNCARAGSNAACLGFDAPSGVDPQTAAAMRSAIMRTFVFGFRLIMLICTYLALASSAVA